MDAFVVDLIMCIDDDVGFFAVDDDDDDDDEVGALFVLVAADGEEDHASSQPNLPQSKEFEEHCDRKHMLFQNTIRYKLLTCCSALSYERVW